MKFFSKSKDGGPDSTVDGYFLIEIKSLFSIALLKFNKGSREAFHTHAFDAWTWFICGDLLEINLNKPGSLYKRTFFPKLTRKEDAHRVLAHKDSWCFTIRGPWDKTWKEYNPRTDRTTTFTTPGRVVIDTQKGNTI